MKASTSSSLPQPEPQLVQHSERALANILAEIKQVGAISFERYMELALYAPGLGYYSSGTAKFGKGGDFVTAPALGSLFAACLARQSAQVLDACDQGDVLEIGAGTGDLAANLLTALAELERLPETYWILERSADLMERQRNRIQKLPEHLASRVAWLSEPPLGEFEGVVIANEVLDALPVHRFRVTPDGPREILVGARDGRLCWEEGPPGGELGLELDRLAQQHSLELVDGYESEVLLHADEWVQSILGGVSRGLILMVDYGYPAAEYYHPQRSEGTLICHFRHRSHNDPFFLPGGQDITAFVDFTRIAWSASRAGLDVVGFTTQAHLLLDLDITDMLDTTNTQQMQEVKLLTLPSEMGERFKALALTRNLDLQLLGFRSHNRLDRL